MSAKGPSFADRAVAVLKRSRTPRSTGELARLFSTSQGRVTDALCGLEKKGVVVRVGLSSAASDCAGTPTWKMAEPAK